MSTYILKVFILNFVLIAMVFVVYGRKLDIERSTKYLLFLTFCLAPMGMAMKGTVSVFFLIDLLGPVLIFIALRKIRQLSVELKGDVLLLSLALLLIPTVATMANYLLSSGSSSQFTSRGMLGLGIWLYRNSLYVAVFTIVAATPRSRQSIVDTLKLIVVFSLPILFLGIIDYSGLIELSVFESILAANNPEVAFNFSASTFGWGYLGMFRGSVGQLGAMMFLVAITYTTLRSGISVPICAALAITAAALVLVSFSRAGLLGLGVGFLVFVLLSNQGRVSIMSFGVLGILLLIPVFQHELVAARITSIVGYADNSEATRMDAWRLALDHFVADPTLLLFGNGATNRQGVAELTGAHGAHNEYIDAVFRSGLSGLVVLLVLQWHWLRRAWRLLRNRNNTDYKVFAALGLALLMCNAVMGLTQDHLYRAYSGYSVGLLMYFLYGLLFSISRVSCSTDQSIVPAPDTYCAGFNWVRAQ